MASAKTARSNVLGLDRELEQGIQLPNDCMPRNGIMKFTSRKERKSLGFLLALPIILSCGLLAGQRPPETLPAAEASVNPGINSKFVDPDLDVDEFVKRFEIESREIYLARHEILKACDIKPGEFIGDIGAGTGLFTQLFSQQSGDLGWVFAVDISPRFIEHINRQASATQLDNITGVLCRENSVNLPPDSCDIIFICDTYHHFEFPQTTMASIHRALKTNGRLIIIDFERLPGKSRPWLISHVRAGKDVFRAEIQDAGFDLVDEKKIKGLKENYFLQFKKNELPHS